MTDVIKKIGVAGSNHSGAFMAWVMAACGYPVIFCDPSMSEVKQGIILIEESLKGEFAKNGREGNTANTVMNRIILSDRYEDLADVDVLFEVFFDDIEIKKDFYVLIDGICKDKCVFATNTPLLGLSDIAAASRRADRVVGASFSSGYSKAQVLEIVRGEATSDETFDLMVRLGKSLATYEEAR
ncbi:MAG: hypothetical protein LBS53_00975 [Synergistaceae bacterium]|jgi:3-hydroxybutyryl-CoA dehydrogenase|nr:hypothetical protein [Synergistaceae bacterium]